MANEWMLETIWNIFVQSPLLILSQIGQIFKMLVGINVVESFGDSSKFNIFYIYAPLTLLAFTICIFLVFYKVLKSKVDNVIEMRKNTISSIKYLFINLAIVFLIPILSFGIAILLCLLANELLNAFYNNSVNGMNLIFDDLSKQIYWIGYTGPQDKIDMNIINGFVPPSNLIVNIAPASPIVYQNSDWNYLIEIVSVLFTCFLPFYLSITFIQKIIEIFVLCMFSPFVMVNNMLDDGAKFKALMFQTLRKSIIIIWTIFCFVAFQLFSTLLASSLNKFNDSSVKGIIYLFSIIAIVICLYLTNFYIARKLDQKVGIVGLYKSSKQTFYFEKEMYTKKPALHANNFNQDLKLEIEKNTNAINNLKSVVNNKSQQHKKLHNINLFS